jgi:hypothetical protein
MNTNGSSSNNDGWTTVLGRREEDGGNRAFGAGMGRRVMAGAYGGSTSGASFGFSRQPRSEGAPAFGRQQQPEGASSFSRGGGPDRQPRQQSEGAAAFSRGGGGGGPDRRAEQRAQQQALEAAEAAARRAAMEAERKREAEATNFASQASYPSLGSAKAKAQEGPKLNYAAKVAEMAAREAEKELQRQLEMEQLAQQEEMDRALGIKKQAPAPKLRVLDDGQGDDFSDIDDDEEDGEKEEDDGELNAHIFSGRRRGDKGVW